MTDEPKAPFAKCGECPLQHTGKYVPSKLPAKADGETLVFIGESPGKMEARRGEPFIGPSGKLLNRVMELHGIKREEVMLTNAANCFLPDQEDKSDLPKAIECCRPRLLNELKEQGIKKAVTLGNAAVSSLHKTQTKITKLRGGEPKQDTYGAGITVVPTFHPAYCLKNEAAFPLLVSDFGKIGPEKVKLFVPPQIRVIEDVQSAITLLDKLIVDKSVWPLVCDTESGKEKDDDIDKSTTILCVGLGSMNPKAGDAVVVIGRPAIEDWRVQDKLCRLLGKRGIIGQNLKYDIGVLRAINHSNVHIPQVGDTMLKSYSLNENPGIHGLEYMGVEYLGAPTWKQEIKKFLKKPLDGPDVRVPLIEYIDDILSQGPILRTEAIKELTLRMSELHLGKDEHELKLSIGHVAKEMEIEEFKDPEAEYRPHQIRWRKPDRKVYLASDDADGSYASIPPEKLHIYNAYDVQATRMLARYFDDRIARYPELVELNKFLMRASDGLTKIESRGIKVDMERNWELYDKYTAQLDEIGEFPFNPNSSTKIIEHFNEELGIETETTDKEFLLSITGDPENEIEPTRHEEPHVVDLCNRLLRYRKAYRFRSTNIISIRNKAMASMRDTIYPSFLLHATTTGRLSSRNPNAQNIPRGSDIKSQFIPSKEGKIWVQADYSQLELRVLACLAHDEYLQELFSDESRDIFVELCLAVFGKRFVNASDAEKAELRTMIKTMAYGLAYGRGYMAIAHAFMIEPDEAKRHMENFYAMVPATMEFQANVVRQVMAGKDLITPFGRHRRFHLITNENKVDVANQAKAFQPQSIGSDCCVQAMTQIVDEVDIRNMVHDSILAECWPNEVEHVKELISYNMCLVAEEVTGHYLPFRVACSTGYRWSECK